MTRATEVAARYRFATSAPAGVLLGLGLRQSIPLIGACVWLTLWLVAAQPLVGAAGVVVGLAAAFGRWRGTPLYDVAIPGAALLGRRRIGARLWVRRSLLAGATHDLPAALAGLVLVETVTAWDGGAAMAAMVQDTKAGTLSLVLPLSAPAFAVASPVAQDAMLSAWGRALAPLARPQCPVARVTWQHRSSPADQDMHLRFLAAQPGRRPASAASRDYDALITERPPVGAHSGARSNGNAAAEMARTFSHDVLVTVTVELRRLRARQNLPIWSAAAEVLVAEARLLAGRWEAAGIKVSAPLSAVALASMIRERSDPSRRAQLATLRRTLAAAAGKAALEWGPMAIEPDWTWVRVDGAFHRTYRVAGWPMLPVPADWLEPLLSLPDATVTTTVVLEPVALARAAAAVNRELTSIEADQDQKQRQGFRLTARERRRHADIEEREQELAAGWPEFRHVGFVTVTAANLDGLEAASARVEQGGAQALLDLRPLIARQPQGWVCSLPTGRNARWGMWS